jgi:tRNA G18 (ribose-2'-O)-methylase SpoU
MLSVALQNLRSLYNVGSIFRTASGAGFDHMYLSGYTGGPPNRRISKVALGAELEVPFSRCTDLGELLSTLEGHHVIALEHHPEAVLYSAFQPPDKQPITLVVGEELSGTPPQLLERADTIAEIPMAGEKESLNVACAFAVAAYDLAIKLGKVGAKDLSKCKPVPIHRPGVLTHGPTQGEAD